MPQVLPDVVQELKGDTAKWPMEVRALVTKLQQRGLVSGNRRSSVRHPFLFEATVRYTSADLTHTQAKVYTRDRNETCIAFLADMHLAVGQYVVLDFTRTEDTAILGQVTSRVIRCRQFHEGWFECVVQLGAATVKPRSTWQALCDWFSR